MPLTGWNNFYSACLLVMGIKSAPKFCRIYWLRKSPCIAYYLATAMASQLGHGPSVSHPIVTGHSAESNWGLSSLSKIVLSFLTPISGATLKVFYLSQFLVGIFLVRSRPLGSSPFCAYPAQFPSSTLRLCLSRHPVGCYFAFPKSYPS